MKTYKIAVVEGDGIGPEVVAGGIDVLERGCQRLVGGFDLEFLPAPAGAGTYLECGEDLPADTLAACREADAILLGACGLPGVRCPDGTEIIPQVTLADRARPVRGHPPGEAARRAFPAPWRATRRSTSSSSARAPRGSSPRSAAGIVLGDQVATDTQVITRRGTERVVRAAFELARRRGQARAARDLRRQGEHPPLVRLLPQGLRRGRRRFPDVAADHLYVDAAAMELVRRPERFDVLVTENLLGDILSDLAAGLVGGLGVAPSADLGDRHAVFQPCHGTAPDIAGRGIANPFAAILSGAMLLDHLARTGQDGDAGRAGRMIEQAVAGVLAEQAVLTADIGGGSSTREVTEAIVARLPSTSGSDH